MFVVNMINKLDVCGWLTIGVQFSSMFNQKCRDDFIPASVMSVETL